MSQYFYYYSTELNVKFCFSVRKVCDVQLNISIEGHPGRVHITEIIDQIDVVRWFIDIRPSIPHMKYILLNNTI